jgi:hypothetical protein
MGRPAPPRPPGTRRGVRALLQCRERWKGPRGRDGAARSDHLAAGAGCGSVVFGNWRAVPDVRRGPRGCRFADRGLGDYVVRVCARWPCCSFCGATAGGADGTWLARKWTETQATHAHGQRGGGGGGGLALIPVGKGQQYKWKFFIIELICAVWFVQLHDQVWRISVRYYASLLYVSGKKDFLLKIM